MRLAEQSGAMAVLVQQECKASAIGERVEKGKLECVETRGKQSCFGGVELDEYINSR